VVEAPGQVAADLDVLDLIAPHRHQVGIDDQDVGRLQDGIVVDADVGGPALVLEVLVGDALVGEVHRALAAQQPRQFGDLGQVVLAVERDPLGIEPEGQMVDRDLPDRCPQRLGIAVGGQRVVAGDEDVEFVVVLQLQELADRAAVVAEVELAGGADAGEDAGHGGAG